MNLWFLGDVHGNFDHIAQALEGARVKPAAVIFLGDLEAPIPFVECCADIDKRGVEWFWIRGNHDTDTAENWTNVSDPVSMARNLDGKIITVAGCRVAGLGGVFRGEVWHPDLHGGLPTHATYAEYEKHIRTNANLKRRLTRKDVAQMQAVAPEQKHWSGALLDASRQGKLLKHRSTIFPADYERLADQKADVLVTHEAPSCHPHGFKEIDLLAQVMGATVIHGHHHDALDYSRKFDALGFRAYGVGFCGITSFDPDTGCAENVVAGDFDQARRYRQSHRMEAE